MSEKTKSYKIADTIITLDYSRSKIIPELKKDRFTEGFICEKKDNSDISIYLEYGYLPNINKTKIFKSGSDWRLSKGDDKYIYEKIDGMYKGKVSQLAIFDKDFRHGEMFIESVSKRKRTEGRGKKRRKEKIENTWNLSNIAASFMQVLLLNFLAHNEEGLLTHSSSLRYNGMSLTFLGKRGAGKSTMAELWCKNEKNAEIFNDDRCVIKRDDSKFNIYSTPWPGSFSKYELAHKEACLNNAYFIYHSRYNKTEKLSTIKALGRIMQNIFPPFWSEKGMKFILSFCHKFVEEVDCYDLGFLNTNDIVNFLKKHICRKEVSCGKFNSFKEE